MRMSGAESSSFEKKMAASRRYFVFLLAIFLLPFVFCLPEPGKKDLHFKKVCNDCPSWVNSLPK